MEERQIIKSLKEGDREAFSMLYKQYWEKVYHFCGLYLNNRDVAEDVVQEVFIKVWESREFIREDDNFKGLLFIITRNLIFNHHRKNVNEDFYKMTVLSAMDTSYDLEEEITAYNLGEYIDHLIEELPERRRVIFNLSRKEHKSYKEIAFLPSIPVLGRFSRLAKMGAFFFTISFSRGEQRKLTPCMLALDLVFPFWSVTSLLFTDGEKCPNPSSSTLYP